MVDWALGGRVSLNAFQPKKPNTHVSRRRWASPLKKGVGVIDPKNHEKQAFSPHSPVPHEESLRFSVFLLKIRNSIFSVFLSTNQLPYLPQLCPILV